MRERYFDTQCLSLFLIIDGFHFRLRLLETSLLKAPLKCVIEMT